MQHCMLRNKHPCQCQRSSWITRGKTKSAVQLKEFELNRCFGNLTHCFLQTYPPVIEGNHWIFGTWSWIPGAQWKFLSKWKPSTGRWVSGWLNHSFLSSKENISESAKISFENVLRNPKIQLILREPWRIPEKPASAFRQNSAKLIKAYQLFWSKNETKTAKTMLVVGQKFLSGW